METYATDYNNCDFEVALLKYIHEEFSGDNVDIACCEFHWKQALRRNLIQFGLPSKEVSTMIGDGGSMEILTIIPVDESYPKEFG